MLTEHVFCATHYTKLLAYINAFKFHGNSDISILQMGDRHRKGQ